MSERDCQHGMYDRDMRCVRCGASVECTHDESYLLQLPAFHTGGSMPLELRQCDWCKRVGVVGSDGNVIWMQEGKP